MRVKSAPASVAAPRAASCRRVTSRHYGERAQPHDARRVSGADQWSYHIGLAATHRGKILRPPVRSGQNRWPCSYILLSSFAITYLQASFTDPLAASARRGTAGLSLQGEP